MSPAPGERVAEDTEVTVTYSKGNIHGVPDVRGSSQKAAEEELKQAGYRVNVDLGDLVPAAEAGKVTDQDPRPGAPLAQGKTVTIVVSQPEPEDETPSPPATPTPTPTTTPTKPGDGNGGGSGLPFPPPPTRLNEQ